MNNIFKNMVYITTLSVVTLYWASTLLYCSPNNFVRIELNSYMKLFDTYLYQKWTFFTPPPKSNQRLYFLYIDKKNPKQIAQCEVIKPLQDQKRENPIFNNTTEVLDDIIAGSSGSLSNTLVEMSSFVKQQYPDSSSLFHRKRAMELICNEKSNISSYRTLVAYAKIVAIKNHIDYRASLKTIFRAF